MSKVLAPTLGSIFERARMFFGRGRPSKGRLFLHLQINKKKLLTRHGGDCKSLGRIVYYCFDKMHEKFCSVSRIKAVFRVCNIKSTCGYHNFMTKKNASGYSLFLFRVFQVRQKKLLVRVEINKQICEVTVNDDAGIRTVLNVSCVSI